MKKSLLLCLLIGLSGVALAQNLVSVTYLGAKSKNQLLNQFGVPFIQFGAKYYRITYMTLDVHGQPDTASGLAAVPDNLINKYPRLVYQHGTASSRFDVPSYNVVGGGEGIIGQLCAGLGYIAYLPDYLGMGTSHGFHPYVHAASEASAALDMLRAADAFEAQLLARSNDQLFITGYSQGGHAAMALHREIEKNHAAEFTVTAASHMSGPYSISGVMRDLVLSDEIYYFPAYIPNFILGYQTVYGNLFTNLTQVFKPAYAALVQQYYTGTINLTDLNTQLIALLTANEGDSHPRRMFQDSLLLAVNSDSLHPINIAMAANDVYTDWAPQSPMRIYYCTADDQVPFENSIVARDSLLSVVTQDFQVVDVNPSADHGGCVLPALTNTVLFFGSLQQISTAVEDPAAEIVLAPNPAQGLAILRNIPAAGQVSLTDVSGKTVYSQATGYTAEVPVDVSGLANGLYIIRFQGNGYFWQDKLSVAH
ncbi:MAG: T9SS C-terminal target domain-containing protein [Bacteroidetes bacterium]|nr:MAG: T9SS C-terminal target domain-containing protein [Bacteroidota bacterium]